MRTQCKYQAPISGNSQPINAVIPTVYNIRNLILQFAKLFRSYTVYKYFKMLSKKRKLNDGDSSNARKKKCTAAICWKAW
jgi:predicted aldo/keto reductase-like oxidoreductase